jgi:predicted dienelactone hydrolase
VLTSIDRARHRVILATLTLLFAGGSVVASGPGADAQTNPFERGPNPTHALLEASRGPFATASTSVSSLVTGFGGGTIHYPTATSEGTFGAVAMAPGYTASSTSYSWLGPRLASHGFVVFLIDTNTRFDFPASRGNQLLAALDYLTRSSSVRGRIDSSRLAVMGHSMGGGGALEAACDRTSLQAAVPLQPWNTSTNFSCVRTPTMIIGAENDTVASVSSHSIPFYNSIPASSEKAYLELNGASHFVANSTNTTLAKYTVAWLKRYVDNDTRYEQFICPAPQSATISDYRDTCPG